jgi:hypothetical protein
VRLAKRELILVTVRVVAVLIVKVVLWTAKVVGD